MLSLVLSGFVLRLRGAASDHPFTCKVLLAASTTAAMDGMCIDKASWQSNVDDKVSAPKLTKEDNAFEAENCQFVWGTQDLTVSDLNALFQKVDGSCTVTAV